MLGPNELGLLLQAFTVTAFVWGFVALVAVIIFKQDVSIALPPWITSAAQSLQRRGQTYIDRFQKWLKQPGQHVRVGLWLGAILIALVTWASPEESFLGQFRTEAVSIALAIIIIDELNRFRDGLRRKQDIIEQMGSPVNDAALEAVRLARKHGWLDDGTLRGANLEGANLKGVHLLDANLKDARLGYANLEDANLFGTKLKDANLMGANLKGACLFDVNLEGARMMLYVADNPVASANLEDAFYNEGTIWPDSYTPPNSAINWDLASVSVKERWRRKYGSAWETNI